MYKYLLLAAVLLPTIVLAQNYVSESPRVQVNAALTTSKGEPRVFNSPTGRVKWSPALPVYQGDIMTVTITTDGSIQPDRVFVNLNKEPYADVKKAPWKVTINTAGLPAGKHVLRGDVRFATDPITYAVAEYVFYVQLPPTKVKGTLQEIGNQSAGMGQLAPDNGSEREKTFTPPPSSLIDDKIQISLQASDPHINQVMQAGEKVRIKDVVAFDVKARPGVDRWAYAIYRNGRMMMSGGPVGRLVRLEIAPKTDVEPGLLPGEVMLYVWGVRNDGFYSSPIKQPLIIEEKGVAQ